MTGTLTYGTDTIRYEVHFLASRQTLAIEVHPDSRVLVRAPVDCPEALIAERVQKRAAWISRQLAEFERYRPRTPARQYVNGESHLYLGRAVFTEVLDASLLHFKGVEQPRLIVRAMQSRWGSLSRAGSMTLNVNLVRAPRACIEYVVTHELCHTKHRDHDARFFRLLGQVMPDWEQRKQRLEAALL